METILFHFFRQQSTAASGSSLFFNWNIFFSQFFILASGNEFFLCWEQYCFIPSFFCYWTLLLKLGESQFSKTNHILASEHKFFNFLKWKQLFWKVETSFSISFIQLVQTDFLPRGNSIFSVRAILLLVENIIGIKRKLLSKKDLILASIHLIFWPVATVFSPFFRDSW